MPDEDYEVNKVIVKDTEGKEIEVARQEDGVYSFPLYTDVTVEVLFKEKLENPKTGVSSFIGIIIIIINYRRKHFLLLFYLIYMINLI